MSLGKHADGRRPFGKLALLLALAMVLALIAMATMAGAVKPADSEKAQKIGWWEVTGGSSNNVTSTPVAGHVNLNTPNGAVTMVINGQITLAPDTTYAVWIRQFGGYTGDIINSYTPLGYYALGYFTTDADGYGSFHFNIRDGDLTAETRNIQLAVNINTQTTAGDVGGYGSTVAATVMYTPITNE